MTPEQDRLERIVSETALGRLIDRFYANSEDAGKTYGIHLVDDARKERDEMLEEIMQLRREVRALTELAKCKGDGDIYMMGWNDGKTAACKAYDAAMKQQLEALTPKQSGEANENNKASC